jgi:hypothetical protein
MRHGVVRGKSLCALMYKVHQNIDIPMTLVQRRETLIMFDPL